MSALVAVIVVAAALLLVWIKFAASRFGNNKYKEAIALEAQGDFKSACYSYAVAILNAAAKSSECRMKIDMLWKQHGPFDYKDMEKEIEAAGDTQGCCGAAGHAATLSIIKKYTKQ